MLRGAQTRISVFFQKPQKVCPAHERQLAGLKRFHRHLVRLARNDGVQPEHFSRLCNPQDDGLAVPRSRENLRQPLAEQKDSMRRLSFHKNNRAFRKERDMLDLIESLQRFLGEGAEEIIRTKMTSNTFGRQSIG
jgi:hypothetical protein